MFDFDPRDYDDARDLSFLVGDRRIGRDVRRRVGYTRAPQRLIVAADLFAPRPAIDAFRLAELCVIDVLEFPVVEDQRSRRIGFE